MIDAQNFGLSDLHQLRGRVGRSNRKAFCYLLAPPLYTLSADSRRRLQAIENFSELGSGIHIAMQDLDIRGAGNLLGAEQSGFIADLGYETYRKILTEAVQELRREEFSDLYHEQQMAMAEVQDFVEEVLVESDLELMFPVMYIPNDAERVAIYRELDNIETETEILDFTSRRGSFRQDTLTGQRTDSHRTVASSGQVARYGEGGAQEQPDDPQPDQ